MVRVHGFIRRRNDGVLIVIVVNVASMLFRA
jgi:hypothetical protein